MWVQKTNKSGRDVLLKHMKRAINMKESKSEKDVPVANNVIGCTFIGVQFDPKSIELLMLVASTGKSIVDLFQAQNVNIDTLLTLTNTTKDSEQQYE